jgi:hypothetical protein
MKDRKQHVLYKYSMYSMVLVLKYVLVLVLENHRMQTIVGYENVSLAVYSTVV